jgi:arylsulfatase
LTDKAIFYIERQQRLAPDRPFFMYFSTGATHEPHQVDREWIEKYKGQFDEGWDVCREKIFVRQKELGVVPAHAELPARNPRVPAWNSLSDDRKKLFARFMEAYAGFMEHTDTEIGRLLEYLRDKDLLDNTVIFLMIGDNGADVGGGHNGEIEVTFPMPITKSDAEQVADMLQKYDSIGTADTYTDYPLGWAQVTNTPYRDWKTMANSEGGARCGMIVHWPNGIADRGGIREQYTYLTDLLPTTLEIAGAEVSPMVKGISQTPIQGVSMTNTFGDAAAPSRHTIQYYFLYGTGAIYKDGWKASFGYRPDFIDLFMVYPRPETAENFAGKEVWELYDVNSDPTEVHDLAKSNPAKLEEMKALFAAEAEANHVYPLINWSDLYPRFQDLLKALRE